MEVSKEQTSVKETYQEKMARMDPAFRLELQPWFTIRETSGEEPIGNCLYHSIGWGLGREPSDETQQFLRDQLAYHLEEHQDDYKHWFDDENLYEEELNRIRTAGCWGGDLAIRIAADAFRRTIIKITAPFVVDSFEVSDPIYDEPIYISYHFGNHFNFLEQKMENPLEARQRWHQKLDNEFEPEEFENIDEEELEDQEGADIPNDERMTQITDNLRRYCYQCDQLYVNLAAHHSRKHVKNHICPFCSNDHHDSCNLSTHIERFHPLEIGLISTTKAPGPEPCRIKGNKLRKLMTTFVEELDDDNLMFITRPNFVLVHDKKRKVLTYGFESKTVSSLTQNFKRGGVAYSPYLKLGRDQMVARQIRQLDPHYEVGHIVPAMFHQETLEDMKDTFMYPNLVPMHRTINRGMWKSSEFLPRTLLVPRQASDFPCLWKRVHIISGPVIDERKQKKAKCGSIYYIPLEFFKVVIMESADATCQMDCFLFPNSKKYSNIYHRRTTLETIEAKTGIRFTSKTKAIPTCMEAAKQGFRCKHCCLAFASELEYNEHFKSHYGKQRCPYCTKWFPNEEYKTHRETAHPLFPCPHPGCTRICYWKNDLKRHMLSHSDEKSFVCKWTSCKKSYKFKNELIVHERIHTGDKPYKCQHCNYRAIRQTYITKHIKNIHKDKIVKPFSFMQTTYPCSHCDVEFKEESELNSHRIMTHSIYQCSLCPHYETNEKSFKSHELEHSKPFKCDFTGCGMRFERKRTLVRHFKVHTKEKPFPCPYCKYRTARKDNLKSHMKNKHKNQYSMNYFSANPRNSESDSSTIEPRRTEQESNSDDDFKAPPQKIAKQRRLTDMFLKK